MLKPAVVQGVAAWGEGLLVDGAAVPAEGNPWGPPAPTPQDQR